MNYLTNETSYSVTGMPINSFQGGSYEMQNALYERIVKYSRATPSGEYMNGGGTPELIC